MSSGHKCSSSDSLCQIKSMISAPRPNQCLIIPTILRFHSILRPVSITTTDPIAGPVAGTIKNLQNQTLLSLHLRCIGLPNIGSLRYSSQCKFHPSKRHPRTHPRNSSSAPLCPSAPIGYGLALVVRYFVNAYNTTMIQILALRSEIRAFAALAVGVLMLLFDYLVNRLDTLRFPSVVGLQFDDGGGGYVRHCSQDDGLFRISRDVIRLAQ
ncbi:hypothetical protein CONLIGDRAFT_368141 [Coniochaeta ligniaria NRRL 30616]|uniref:Uncharacterized protein n=1 Tax=Coniochaeta ligniaria NRRL 30616 TaxID=1408157 RepID=A0A1J7I3P4_9PEZI|nr:hypothetical protein CONLIGDRAFT_368141 [Coniochaeta ligniaria NRRL 30616]